eukprot:7376907-Alexandrium_andersonii.AAC.1
MHAECAEWMPGELRCMMAGGPSAEGGLTVLLRLPLASCAPGCLREAPSDPSGTHLPRRTP